MLLQAALCWLEQGSFLCSFQYVRTAPSLRHVRSSEIPIEVILEAPVAADEVELHVEARGQESGSGSGSQ